MYPVLLLGENVRAGASSRFEAETKITGVESARNHGLLLKMWFNIEGNNQTKKLILNLGKFPITTWHQAFEGKNKIWAHKG